MYSLVTSSNTLPLTLAEAKAYLRASINNTTEDDVITMCLKSAIDQCQAYAWLQFINATWSKQFTSWPNSLKPYLELGKGPVNSIVSVKYNDENNQEQTLSEASYTLNEKFKPGRLFLISTPTLSSVNPYIRVEYVAGFGEQTTDVPNDIKNAIALLCNQMYDNRENDNPNTMPLASERVLARYRYQYADM